MAYTQFPSGGVGAAAVEVAPSFLLELIAADLHWMALQVGMIAMMTTACAAERPRCSLHAIRHLLQNDGRNMQLALRYAPKAGVSAQSGRKLNDFYAEVVATQKLIAPFVEPRSLSPHQTGQLGRLLPVLHKLALTAVEAIESLEPFLRMHRAGDVVEDAGVIREFLGRAARGDTSEIDRFGVVTPPRLKQRRHSPRVNAKIACRVLHAAGEADAVIFDVSRNGLGLTCEVSLAAAEAVEVAVGGRRLEAEVMRQTGGQLGLKLKNPLAVSDPLFRGA